MGQITGCIRGLLVVLAAVKRQVSKPPANTRLAARIGCLGYRADICGVFRQNGENGVAELSGYSTYRHFVALALGAFLSIVLTKAPNAGSATLVWRGGCWSP